MDPLAPAVVGLLRLHVAGHRAEQASARNPVSRAYHWLQSKRYEAAFAVLLRSRKA